MGDEDDFMQDDDWSAQSKTTPKKRSKSADETPKKRGRLINLLDASSLKNYSEMFGVGLYTVDHVAKLARANDDRMALWSKKDKMERFPKYLKFISDEHLEELRKLEKEDPDGERLNKKSEVSKPAELDIVPKTLPPFSKKGNDGCKKKDEDIPQYFRVYNCIPYQEMYGWRKCMENKPKGRGPYHIGEIKLCCSYYHDYPGCKSIVSKEELTTYMSMMEMGDKESREASNIRSNMRLFKRVVPKSNSKDTLSDLRGLLLSDEDMEYVASELGVSVPVARDIESCLHMEHIPFISKDDEGFEDFIMNVRSIHLPKWTEERINFLEFVEMGEGEDNVPDTRKDGKKIVCPDIEEAYTEEALSAFASAAGISILRAKAICSVLQKEDKVYDTQKLVENHVEVWGGLSIDEKEFVEKQETCENIKHFYKKNDFYKVLGVKAGCSASSVASAFEQLTACVGGAPDGGAALKMLLKAKLRILTKMKRAPHEKASMKPRSIFSKTVPRSSGRLASKERSTMNVDVLMAKAMMDVRIRGSFLCDVDCVRGLRNWFRICDQDCNSIVLSLDHFVDAGDRDTSGAGIALDPT